MSRPPHAREAVLDAFESLLISEGVRAATLASIARTAGVSKGGLLYHFPSKAALQEGLILRLQDLVEEDLIVIENASEGPVRYFLHSSVMTGTPLDKTVVALTRIAQAGGSEASKAIQKMRDEWARILRRYVPDHAALNLVMFVSDGIYFNNSIAGGAVSSLPDKQTLNALLNFVEEIVL